MNDTRYRTFERSLQSQLEPIASRLIEIVERTLQGPITPNGEADFSLRRFRHYNELRDLAIFSWFLGEYGVLLREGIRKKNKAFRLADRERLAFLLNSKEDMLSYLTFTTHERSFFGNLLGSIKRNAERLRFRVTEPRKATRKQRRRGYSDQGSCRPQHQQHRNEMDYELIEEQLKIERERDFEQTVFQAIEKYGLLGVRLPELEGKSP